MSAAHDPQRVLHVLFDVEAERHLVRIVRKRNRADAFDGKHPDFLAQMTVTDQVQSACGEPEIVRIDLAPSGAAAGSRIVTNLSGSLLVDGLRDKIDGFLMFPITLMWPEADGKHLLHRPNIFVALRRQGRGGFAQSRVERGLDLSAF